MIKEMKKILILVIYIGLILISTKVNAVSGIPTTETVRLRKEASTNSDVIELISQNEEVEIISEEGEWYKVNYKKNQKTHTGYVRKDLIEVKGETEEKTSEQSQTQNTIADDQQVKENEQSESNSNNNTENDTKAQENTTNEIINNSQVQKGYTATTVSNLDIKIVPSINSSKIGTIAESTLVTVTDIMNKWCYVETEQTSGWVLVSKLEKKIKPTIQENSNEQIQEKQEVQEEQKEDSTKIVEESKEEKKEQAEVKTTTKYVSAETLNVRESTETDAKVIEQLPLNTSVTVLEEVDKTWSKIKAKGKTGYVASKYLSDKKVEKSSRSEDETRTSEAQEEKTTQANNENKTEQSNIVTTTNTNASTTTASSSSASSVVSYAKQYLGYKYVSGGASPQSGFDCSGFTSYVYKNFGKSLSRTSSAQASDGVAVSKENLQPGDIVVFNNSSNTAVGHVGIYIGSNTFIHAANAKKGVITTSLSDSYYSARYVTARRILN